MATELWVWILLGLFFACVLIPMREHMALREKYGWAKTVDKLRDKSIFWVIWPCLLGLVGLIIAAIGFVCEFLISDYVTMAIRFLASLGAYVLPCGIILMILSMSVVIAW